MNFWLAAIASSINLVLSPPIVRPQEQVLSPHEFPNPESAEQWYEWAITQIQDGNNEGAKKSLERALSLEPEFPDAKTQLAFIWLWEGDLDASYEAFFDVLQAIPCEPRALDGLEELGGKWNQVESKQEETVEIYRVLNQCRPKNPDTLFYLGRALARTKRWEEAEAALKECLELAPQYGDAKVQLGYLYLWQERYSQAEEIFAQFPENSDAKMGLVLATKRQGKTKEAKQHLEEVLSVTPNHRPARKEKAAILLSERDYFGADTEYSWLIDDDPNEGDYWAELFDIKSHSRCSLFLESFYTYAKENDPDLNAPVVKNYYFMNAVHLIVPLTNQWQLDLKEIYYHQRENDIYPPIGVNYSMYLSGGQAAANYYFAKDWRWSISARGFSAWGKQNANYPFHKTARFEPGTGILYNSQKQLFSADFHVESFVIKNFTTFTSYLLRTDFLTGGYAYRSDIILKPEVEAWISHVFIHDHLHNWRNTEIAIARCQVPYMGKYLSGIYQFEHGHYDKLNVNYYSFKQQFRNVIGTRLHIPFSDSISWDSYYFHRWQTTYDLFQPIGNFILIAPKQYLAANWVSSTLTARYRDRFRLVIEGRYFHDTLPYRDWTLSGSLLWQF